MDERLIYFTGVLSLGIAAQWLAWRFKLPSILLLLGFGFAAGQVYDQSRVLEDQVLFAFVSLAVGVILLEGGLTLRFAELKEAGAPVLRLVTVGAAITWFLTIPAAHFVAGFSWPVATLLAAILVVTGPTVIGPILRVLKPVRSVNSILKWEGIVIDPIGAVLAVLVFGVMFGHGHGNETTVVVMGLIKTLVAGLGLGYVVARILIFVLCHHWVPDYLQSVVILALSLVVFVCSNLIQHESGLLAITVMGVVLANQSKAQIRHIIEFKESLRIILISTLFIILGGRVMWTEIVEVWKGALMFLAVLIIVVRPVSVFLCTIGSNLTRNEKLFLAMMAPRGIVAAAVASIFAIEIIGLGGEYAEEGARIVPFIFTVIVGTVLFYGLCAGPIARKLGLASDKPQGVLFAGIRKWVIEAAIALEGLGFRCLLVDSSYAATARARMAGVHAVNANILSEFVTEELDLSGIGRVLAVTSNDQVNSLACMGFSHAIGRSNVFQLAPGDSSEPDRMTGSGELLGRILFAGEHTTDRLNELEASGGVVKTTPITDEFTQDDFLNFHSGKAISLFIFREGGDLSVVTEESQPAGNGDSIVALVPSGK